VSRPDRNSSVDETLRYEWSPESKTGLGKNVPVAYQEQHVPKPEKITFIRNDGIVAIQGPNVVTPLIQGPKKHERETTEGSQPERSNFYPPGQ
jgi:hypothetical protein